MNYKAETQSMAAKKPITYTQMSNEHRTKIANSQILKCLVEHAEGRRKLEPSQVTAGLGLLRKVMPDLSASEITHNTGKMTELSDDEIIARLAALGIATDKPIDNTEQSDTKH